MRCRKQDRHGGKVCAGNPAASILCEPFQSLEIRRQRDKLKGITMKTIGLSFLLAATSVSAQTNAKPFCCRHPVRILGEGETANLAPLLLKIKRGRTLLRPL
jgi:hypothetical protein